MSLTAFDVCFQFQLAPLHLGVIGLANLVGVGFVMVIGYGIGGLPTLLDNVTW
jgi:hypothetical protein